ncbi:clavesin-1-like [Sabethes cyaneus]|uniref:clavesin-1-like n=1 Tax=Sabethes cyaneus TaxID=53552 RepID=UPI00237D3463|nr:clavesin-1-like [Sabethes cyaneus]
MELSVEKCPNQYDTYEFTVGDLYRQIAEKDLNETEEIRQQSLAQMREWIAKHPYISKCRTDSLFLLRFLRMRKFSIPKTQETLERYLAMRQAFPHWFQKLDPMDADMQQLLEDNQFQILGQDSKGRTVILMKTKCFNADKFTSEHQSRHVQLLLETLFDDEQTQIGGFVVILDYMDMTMRQLAVWSLMDVKNFISCVNHSLPIRLREVHAIRLPKFAVTIAELAMSCLSQKLRERVFCHKTLAEAKKHLQESLLPTDYEGGTQDPQELKQKFINRARGMRNQLLQLDQLEIDATRYKSLWQQSSDISIDSGVAGSFRQLGVD